MTKLRAAARCAARRPAKARISSWPLISIIGLLRIASTVKQSTTASISPLSSAQQFGILRRCRVEDSAFRRARLSATALIWLVTCSAASGQTGPGGADSYTLMIEAICRRYAAAVTGMPPDRMFAQCMAERDCRISPGSASYHCEPPGPISNQAGCFDGAPQRRELSGKQFATMSRERDRPALPCPRWREKRKGVLYPLRHL